MLVKNPGRITLLVETTLQDVRYAVRAMRRSPVFALVAVLTLALAIGAISTVLDLANTFFFRRLPVDRPEELVTVSPTRRHGTIAGSVSWNDYTCFRTHSQTLQGLAAHYSTAPLFVSIGDNAREINGAVTSANFFPLLGIKPALGRFFRADEDSVPDRDRVAVLGYQLWHDWFGASTDALGAAVRINGVPFTVIGVAPASFRGMSAMPSEIYIPAMMLRVGYRYCDVLTDEDCTILSMVGRLAPARTVEEARAEMATLVPARWAHAAEGDNTGVTVRPERGKEHSESEVRLVQILLMAVGVLLLVCCANLAGLLTARGTARVREFAIRASIGAGRLRLVRQLLTESVLLAVLGGLLGMLVSIALTNALSSMFYSMDDEGHALWYDFSPEPVVLVIVCLVSIGAGFLFGLLPAIRSSRLGLADGLKGEASAVTAHSQAANWLVGIQAALAVALVTVASLLLASTRLLATGTHFEPGHVALMRLRPRMVQYSPQRAQQFQRAVIRRLESIPGVESATMVGTGGVLTGGQADLGLPHLPDQKRQAIRVGYIDVGPRYFETLRTPLRRGREFDDRDSPDTPRVAIVNQTLANRLWPSGKAVGETITVERQTYRIVGIVEDVPLDSRTEAARPYVYLAFWQNPGEVDARLCIRVRGDAAAMLPVLAREVHHVDPNIPIAETMTLPLQLKGMFQPLRVTATFLSWAAGLAVLLSAIGLYGAISFAVSRRTKEIGIRMTLGAEPRGVLAMVIRQGMIVVLLGALSGLAMATLGVRLVRHLLLGSAQADALFYAGAALLILFVGLFACWFPARRAASVEPLQALRSD
jgi:macrolide transport system ATP-binding/permease protein